MATQYGVTVTNKFALDILDDEDDPFEVLIQQEELKKKQELLDKANKGKTSNKTKQAKKNVLSETKNKQTEQTIQKKEVEKTNSQPQSRSQNDRPPRSARQNRDQRDSRGEDGERRFKRREENVSSENRFQTDRSDGGSGRPDSGFARGDGGRGFGGRGRGGPRGRGTRGVGRGGFESRGKREFDRHSGSDKTSGVRGTDKRDGGGAHNWGTVKDDLEEQIKDIAEQQEPKDENTENQDPNESTESTEQPEDASSKQMTLAEWKSQQEKTRVKASFNIRKAGEGCDSDQWKKGIVYKKPEVEDDEEEEEEDEEDDEDYDHKSKHVVTDIKITFNDSPRRGRGGRRPRGGRGGRGMGGGRGDRRGGSRDVAPKFDDENDFPSLVKTEA